MRKKLLIKSMGITMMLATIAIVTLCTSVSAWSGYKTKFDGDDDGATWQVSTRVTGYYWTAGQYEEVLHQSWRGCMSPTYYTEGEGLTIRWYGTGPYGYYDTGFEEHGDEDGPYYLYAYIYPYPWFGIEYVTCASSYSGAWFDISGQAQYKQCQATI